jgi:S-adenosylmethionine uptake transporter
VILIRLGPAVLRSTVPGLQIARGVAAAGSATSFLVGISIVPLADATAVAFIAPFLVTLLAAFALGESVGIRRWTAVAIGFIGALIIIQPGAGMVDPAMGFVVIAAGLFALRQILSRRLGGADSIATTICYTALVAFVLVSLPLPFFWTQPDGWPVVLLLIAIAAMAGMAEVLVIRALALAHAVVVAPLQYSLLIWATGYGYWLFGQFPNAWTWAGALILMITGAYTLHREYVTTRNL